jgi:hypothetical protein
VIANAIAQRNKQASQLLTPDFTDLGWDEPAEGAALWNGLVVEAALLELVAGAPGLDARAAARGHGSHGGPDARLRARHHRVRSHAEGCSA